MRTVHSPGPQRPEAPKLPRPGALKSPRARGVAPPRAGALAGQRGTSLIEALLAFLVLSLGLVGIAKLHGEVRLNADVARQRTEALRLAQDDIEALRAFTTLSTDPLAVGYADIVDHAASPPASGASATNASFELQRDVVADEGFRSAALTVRWLDRRGQAQQLTLQSLIAGTSPALSGALAAQAAIPPFAALRGRAAAIPPGATPLGNGTSAFKPAGDGASAWVFDDTTGEIVAMCDTTATAHALSAAQLSACIRTNALLLSGVVRLSLAGSAQAMQANDTPLPLAVVLTLTGRSGAPAPICVSEAQKQVAIPTATGVRREAVPLAAVPADWGVTGWTELGDRFVAYHCAVTPLQGHWSGRTTIVPQGGWRVGTGVNDFRVCRYSADHDGSGSIDQNAEHPDEYHHVDRALMQQNFLLLPGPLACPAAPPVSFDAAAPVHADLSTVQHQP